MQTTTVKLVTIIAENVLEARLIEDIQRLGAHGYTVMEVRGAGAHGVRASGLAEGINVRIETLVNPAVANQILTYVSEHYFANYAIVAYVETVEVVRGEKYN